MTTQTTTRIGAVYMQVKDRKKIDALMTIHGVSQRQLAEAAGWGPNSHSFVARIIRGSATSVSAESAVRIALRLGSPVDELFVTKLDTKATQTKPQTRTVRRNAA